MPLLLPLYAIYPHASAAHTLQPPAFVFYGHAAASAHASVAFPDVLPLEVGKAVKLGIMRQIAPGEV
jgi:hypothetical protein